MPSCYVFGCKTGYSGQRGYHLFKISKKASVETRNLWSQNIPKRVDKEFNFKTCFICDGHFEEHFIQKTNVLNVQLNITVPRKTWKLTDDAVPTKFLNLGLPSYLETKATRRRPPLTRITSSINSKSQTLLTTNQNHTATVPTCEQIGSTAQEVSSICLSDFNEPLPTQWMKQDGDKEMVVSKLVLQSVSAMEHYVVERKLTLDEHGNVKSFIRGKSFSADLLGIESKCTTMEQFKTCIDQMNTIQLCCGVQNMRLFQSFPNSVQVGNSWFAETCEILAIQAFASDFCNACKDLKVGMTNEAQKLVRAQLAQGRSAQDKQAKNQIGCGPYTTKNLRRRLRRLQMRNNILKLEHRQLRLKLACSDAQTLHDVVDKADLNPAFKLALKTTISLEKSKSNTGRRYSADWILQAILLKITSPKAYKHLRAEGILPLPNPSYLTQLLRGVKCQFGFSKFVLDHLKQEFQNKPQRDRQVFLVFDEMKVKESITFDRFTVTFTGFVDYDDFSSDKPLRSKKPEADHALVFMVRGLNSKMTQPFASFATRGAAPGNVLAKMIISAIVNLEKAGLEVVGVVSDGATTIKSAWKCLGIGQSQNGTIVNKITNPVDDSRNVYFLCDVPHIFKCIRNNVHKHKYCRYGNLKIDWHQYEALYLLDSKNVLRAAPKLTNQHINPGPFQKMSVKLAVQLFSKTVADALKFYRTKMHERNLQNSEDTEEFSRVLNNLFDACNARGPRDGVKPGSVSYITIKTFLTSIQDSDTFAATTTLQALKITLQSVLDLTDYLCGTVGFAYVCTEKFNQDCLEKFFGLLRSFGGDDAHPTVTSFTQLFRLLSIYNPTSRLIKGNVKESVALEVKSKPFTELLGFYRKQLDKERQDMKLHVENEIIRRIIAGELDAPKSELSNSSTSCMVYHLAGFVAFKRNQFTNCEKCRNLLCYKSYTPEVSSLTHIKDMGRLTAKSIVVFFVK